MINKNMFKSKRFRYGSFATAVMALFLVAVIMINVIATLLADRYNLKIDLTSSGVFQISEDVQAVIDSLEDEITINILASEEDFIYGDDYFVVANEVIKLFATSSSLITVNYLDTVKDPTVLTTYSEYDPSSCDIIVESSLRTVYVSFGDLFSIYTDDYGSSSITGCVADYEIGSAIITATSTDQPLVSILTGYEEVDISGLEYYLEANNFEVIYEDITTVGITSEADIVIIACPENDYDAASLDKLDDFLYNGGDYSKNLVYITGVDQGDTPNIDAFLADWGITPLDGVVAETDTSNIFNYNSYFARIAYANSDVAGDLTSGSLYPAVLNSTTFEINNNMSGARSTDVLLQFNSTSVLVPSNSANDDTYDFDALEQYAYPVVVMGTMGVTGTSSTGTGGVKDSQVVAIGSTSLVDASFLSSTSVSNGEWTINMFNYLVDRDDALTLVTKSIGGTDLSIDTNQANILMVIFLIVVPILVFGCGFYVWLRRRHL